MTPPKPIAPSICTAGYHSIVPLRLVQMQVENHAIPQSEVEKLLKEKSDVWKKEFLKEKKWSESALTQAQVDEFNKHIKQRFSEEASLDDGIDAYLVVQRNAMSEDGGKPKIEPNHSLKPSLMYTFQYLPLDHNAQFTPDMEIVEAFLSGKVTNKEICGITQKVKRDGKEVDEAKALVLTGLMLERYGPSIAKFHPLKLNESGLNDFASEITQVPVVLGATKDLDVVGQTVWQRLEYVDSASDDTKPRPLLLSPQEAFHLLVNLSLLGVKKPWDVLRPGEPIPASGETAIDPYMPGGAALSTNITEWPSQRGIGTWRPYYLNVKELSDEQMHELKRLIGVAISGKDQQPVRLQEEENPARVLVIGQALDTVAAKCLPLKAYPLKLSEEILNANTGRIAKVPKELSSGALSVQDTPWRQLTSTETVAGKPGEAAHSEVLLLSPQEVFHLLINLSRIGVAEPWTVLRPGAPVLPDGAKKFDPRTSGGQELPGIVADWATTRAIGTWRPYYIDVKKLRDEELLRLQTLVGQTLMEAQSTQGTATITATNIQDLNAVPNPDRVTIIQKAISPLVALCNPSSAPTIEVKFARQSQDIKDKILATEAVLDQKAPMLSEAVEAEKDKKEKDRGRISSTVGLKQRSIAWLTMLLEEKGRTGAIARCHGDTAVDLNVSIPRNKEIYRDVDEALAGMLSGLSPTSTDAMALQNLKGVLVQDGAQIGGEIAGEHGQDSNDNMFYLFLLGGVGSAFAIWQIGVTVFNAVAGGFMDFSPERLARGVTFLGDVGAVVNEISARQTRIVQRAEKLWIRDRRKLLKLTDITQRNARLFWLRKNKKWQKFVTEAERQERIKEEMLKAGLDLDIYPNGERSESDEQRRAVSEYSFQHKSEFESNPLTPRALEIYAKAKTTYDPTHTANDPLDVDAWTRAVEAERPVSRSKYASGETPLTKWTEDLVELDRTGGLRRANLPIREREIVQLARNLAANQNTGLDSINGGVGKDLIWNGTAHLLRLATDFEAGKSAQGAAYQPNPEWTALSSQLKIAGLEMVEANVELYRLKAGAVASGGAGDRGLMAGQVAGILLDIQDGMRDESSEQVGTRDPSKPLRSGAVRRGGLAQLKAEGKRPMLVVSELKTVFSIGAHRGNEGGDLKYILDALDDGRFPMSGNWTYRDKAEALMNSAPGVSRFDGIHVDDLDVDKAGQSLVPLRDAVKQGSATQPPMIVEIDALQELARLVDEHRGTEAWDLRNPVDAKAYELIPEEHRQSMSKDVHGNPVAPSSGLGRPVRQAFESFIKWRIGEQLAGMRADGGVAELRAARERLLKESDGSPLQITVADVTRFAEYRWPPNAASAAASSGLPPVLQPSAKYQEAEADLRGKLADFKTEFSTHDVSDLEALVDAGLAEIQGKSDLEIAQMRRVLKKEIGSEAKALRAPPGGFFTPDIFLRPIEALVEYAVIKPVQALVRGAELAMNYVVRQAHDERRVSGGATPLVGPGEVDFAALAKARRAGQRPVVAEPPLIPILSRDGTVPGKGVTIPIDMPPQPKGLFDEAPKISPEMTKALQAEAVKTAAKAAKVVIDVKAKADKFGKDRL